MEFSRQEFSVHCLLQRIFPTQGIKSRSPSLQASSLLSEPCVPKSLHPKQVPCSPLTLGLAGPDGKGRDLAKAALVLTRSKKKAWVFQLRLPPSSLSTSSARSHFSMKVEHSGWQGAELVEWYHCYLLITQPKKWYLQIQKTAKLFPK